MRKSILYLILLGFASYTGGASQDTLKPSFVKKLTNDQLRAYYKEAQDNHNKRLAHQVSQELKARGAQLSQSKYRTRNDNRQRRPDSRQKTPTKNIPGRTQQTPPPVPPRDVISIPNPPPLQAKLEQQERVSAPSLAEQLRAQQTRLKPAPEVSTEKIPSAKMRWDNLKAQGNVEQLRLEKMELNKQMAQAGLRLGMSQSKENKERFEQLEIDYDYVNSLLPQDEAINEDDDIEWA